MFAIRSACVGVATLVQLPLSRQRDLGAVAGASITPALIELYGFHGTLRVGARAEPADLRLRPSVLTLRSTAVAASAATSHAQRLQRCRSKTSAPSCCCCSHRPGHHGHGGHLDPAVHLLRRPGGVFVRENPGRRIWSRPFWARRSIASGAAASAATRTGCSGFRWRFSDCCLCSPPTAVSTCRLAARVYWALRRSPRSSDF